MNFFQKLVFAHGLQHFHNDCHFKLSLSLSPSCSLFISFIYVFWEVLLSLAYTFRMENQHIDPPFSLSLFLWLFPFSHSSIFFYSSHWPLLVVVSVYNHKYYSSMSLFFSCFFFHFVYFFRTLCISTLSLPDITRFCFVWGERTRWRGGRVTLILKWKALNSNIIL